LCRALVLGSSALFWGWLISTGHCVRNGPLLGDAIFVACLASMIAYVTLQLQRGVGQRRHLQACLVGLVLSAWATLLLDAHSAWRPAAGGAALAKYYAQCAGLVALSWVAVMRNVHAEGTWEPVRVARPCSGSDWAQSYAPIHSETGDACGKPKVDQAWYMYWDLSGTILPIAVMLSMPWQAQVGFAQFPPLMPYDFPKDGVVFKPSLSGYIDAPEGMAMFAAAMSCVFVNFWRYLDKDILHASTLQLTMDSTVNPNAPDRSWHNRVHLPGRFCFLVYTQMFFGLFMVMTYSWQPLPHTYLTALFGGCAATLIVWVMCADKRLRSTWLMPGLFAAAMSMFVVVLSVNQIYGGSARLPDYLIVPYPGSPTDDNLFWLCETTSLSLTCLIAPVANILVERQGSRDNLVDSKA